MRNITDVIDKLEAESENYDGMEEFRKELEFIRYDSMFTAPELMYLRWRTLRSIINSAVGPLSHPMWVIFSGIESE